MAVVPFVGAGAPLDGGIAINEAMVQVDMSAGFVAIGLLKKLAADSETLRASFSRHEEMVLAQVQQVAACNALHSLEQRLSRWLLQARDLVNDDVLPLTQNFLSQMLGVHRSSLTLIARRLQEAGLINYHHGSIQIRDVEADLLTHDLHIRLCIGDHGWRHEVPPPLPPLVPPVLILAPSFLPDSM